MELRTIEDRLYWARKEIAFCNQGFIYRYVARKWSIREIWFLLVASGIILNNYSLINNKTADQ